MTASMEPESASSPTTSEDVPSPATVHAYLEGLLRLDTCGLKVVVNDKSIIQAHSLIVA